MPERLDPPFPSSGKYAAASWRRFTTSDVKRRLFSELHVAMQKWRPISNKKDESALQPQQIESYLAQCCDRAMDAYTVEDALNWQQAIVDELKAHIETLELMELKGAAKFILGKSLQRRLETHTECVERLQTIVVNNQQFYWSP